MINMLLEPKLKMNISILDFIYDNNNWTKSSTISEELGVSERTVQHYFKDIFDLKQQYDDTTDNNLSILYFKTKGICIIDYTNNFEDFKKFILKSSLTITLLEDIIKQQVVSVAQYSQKYFISETTIRKSLKRIKQTCRRYGIDLSHFELIGDEKMIRLFVSLFHTAISRHTYYLVDGMDYEKLTASFQTFFEKIDINLSAVKKQKVQNCFLIHLQRISLNKKINFDEYDMRIFKNHPMYIELCPIFHDYLIYDEREIAYFLSTITLDEELHRNDQANIIYNYYKKENLDLYATTCQIFEALKIYLRPLSPATIQTIKQDLFYINYTTIHYGITFFQYKYGGIVDYPTENFNLITRAFKKEIEQQLVDNHYITQQQVDSVIQQYFFRLFYFVDSTYLDKVIHIYIEPSFDHFQQQQIKDYLNIYFNHQADYPDTYDKDVVDMVLTPYHETYQNDCYPSDLVTLVKFPLTPSFFKAIEMKLDHVNNQHNSKYDIY